MNASTFPILARAAALAALLLAAVPVFAADESANEKKPPKTLSAPPPVQPPASDPLRPATPPAAERYALPDSTVIETFTLPNGLRVITRHVPLSSAVAIALAFDAGDRDDPSSRIGLARLTGKLRFFSSTELEPARNREQLSRLRPSGWDLQVGAHSTRMVEVATLGQFPGVLHQVAARLRGVQVSDPELKAMIETVRQDLASNYRDSLDRAIVYRTRAIAEGDDEAAIGKRAAGSGIQTISLREVRDALAAQGTRQAVLSLAGDMTAYPMRQLIENEFGGIKASEPSRRVKRSPLQPAQRSVVMPGLTFPLASVGIVAPAFSDTMHPEFYAASVRLGAYMLGKWGRPDPPFTSRFRYQVLDDPELAIFFPPLTVEGLTIPQMQEEFSFTAGDAFYAEPPEPLRLAIQRGVTWMLGGPLPSDLLVQARGGGSVLVNLASTAAGRALLGDEAFWALYRTRFERGMEGQRADWKEYFQDTGRHVEMVLLPSTMR